MSYDEALLEQVRDCFATRSDVREQRSIGGSRTFTVRGNLCCGVGKWGLMVRVGPQLYEATLKEPYVSPLGIGSKTLQGYVRVEAQALADDGALEHWVHRGLRFVLTLPAKPAKTAAAPSRRTRRS